MPLPRSMAEILGAHADALKNEIRKVLPATVLAVNPAAQTVDVQVAINNPIHDDLGNTLFEDAPSISNVPLCGLRGGGFLIYLPVTVGDSVLLVFSDLSADTWREAGGPIAQDPGAVHKHTFDSPFAIPMIAPDASAFVSPGSAPTELIIGKDTGTGQIRISASSIDIGGLGAGTPLALAVPVVSAMGADVTAWTAMAALCSAMVGLLTTPPTSVTFPVFAPAAPALFGTAGAAATAAVGTITTAESATPCSVAKGA